MCEDKILMEKVKWGGDKWARYPNTHIVYTLHSSTEFRWTPGGLQ